MYEIITKLFGLEEPVSLPAEQKEKIRSAFGNIPKALEEYYDTCGGCAEMNSTQDVLITPDGIYGAKLGMWNEEGWCIFYAENQSVSVWGFKAEDSAKDDPDVYEALDMDGKLCWTHVSKSISQFLKSQAFLQAVFSFEYSTEDFYIAALEQIDAIADMYPEADAGSMIYCGVRFFQPFPDTVIAVMRSSEDEDEFQVIYSSKTEEHFDQTDQELAEILGEE